MDRILTIVVLPAPFEPRRAFAGFRFQPELITLAVRWYLRYELSYAAGPGSVRSIDGRPRHYQIAVLASLLTYGAFGLAFDISVLQAVLTIAVCLLTQAVCTQVWRLPAFDPRSALISRVCTQ